MALLGASAQAIVGGTADAVNSVYQYMGKIGRYGATPISSSWLVTARHINIPVGATFTNPEGSFLVDQVVTDGSSDLALIHISGALIHFYGYADVTNVTPVALLGSGKTGTATSTGYSLSASDAATRQIGFNTIEDIGLVSFNGGQTAAYIYDLDGNGINAFGNAGIPGEAGVADGDSGSGWFVDAGGTPLIVAVSSGVGDNFAGTGYGTSGSPYDFGDVGFGTSLGFYSAFITRTTGVAPVPEPAPMAALGLGALALLRRKRK